MMFDDYDVTVTMEEVYGEDGYIGRYSDDDLEEF